MQGHKGWDRRYFVFRDERLCYYNKKPEKDPKPLVRSLGNYKLFFILDCRLCFMDVWHYLFSLNDSNLSKRIVPLSSMVSVRYDPSKSSGSRNFLFQLVTKERTFFLSAPSATV